MKNNYFLVRFGLAAVISLTNGIVQAQNTNPLVQAVKYNGVRDTAKINGLLKDAVEDVSKRTMFSSTWKAKGGRVIARYSSIMINYPDAQGNLHPVDLSLHSDPQGWVADGQPNPSYFHLDRSTTVNMVGGKQITFNKNCTINDMPLDENIMSIEKNQVKLDLTEGIKKEVDFIPGGVESSYTFASPLDGGITVKEEIEFPEGCSFQKDSTYGRIQPGGGWAGDYVLLTPDGKRVLVRLSAATCYDSKGHWCIANYSIQKKDGKNILVTTVPSNWLSKAVYPVTLDPRIAGPLSQWMGGSSPSCLYPNYHTDSILVTIPSGITVTFFNITYAYVTNPVGAGVPKSDGFFYLSNSCAKTDTIGCDTSRTPGTCYLTPGADFHNPFTCCYPPSCNPQQFWLYAHLSRLHGFTLTSCDTNWVWYTAANQNGNSQQYYFSAYVEGYTDSISNAAGGLTYTPASQCSNICTITMKANLAYGVPPYKVSHPWAARDTIVGSYSGCSSQGQVVMQLKVPGCPYTCGKIDTILIPSPIVVDACGDTALRAEPFKYAIRPVPVITYKPEDSSVCSGLPIKLSLKSCVTGTVFNWIGTDLASGSTDSVIVDNTNNTGNSPIAVTYTVTASANGCNSDTIEATAVINPYPSAVISGVLDTLVLGNSEKLVATEGAKTYSWSPSAGLSCTNCPNPTASPTVTTKYTVTITDSGGCQEVISFTIYVLDENIVVPNVITPGVDNINGVFAIKNMQEYPNSKLVIFDRWGKQLYSTNNYQNNWDGGGQSAGVYYYILTLPSGTKYQGFFQIIK